MLGNRGKSPKSYLWRTDHPGVLLWHLPSCLQHNACLNSQREKQRIKGVCHHLTPHFTGLQGKEEPNEILTEGATASFFLLLSCFPGCAAVHSSPMTELPPRLGTSMAPPRAPRHSNSCRNTTSVLGLTKNCAQGWGQ